MDYINKIIKKNKIKYLKKKTNTLIDNISSYLEKKIYDESSFDYKQKKNKKNTDISDLPESLKNFEENYITNIINEEFTDIHLLHNNSTEISYELLNTINNISFDDIIFPSNEFDCIITGGGLKGYYVYGSLIILKKLINAGKIKIRKIVGVSAGSFLSVFIMSDLSIHTLKNVHNFALANNSKHNIDKIMIKACFELFPDDIHEKINDKISILVSKATYFKTEEIYINKFESKMHLIQALHASSFIPFITSKSMNGVHIKGEKYYDGFFSNFIPINFNNDLPQLVFHTHDVDYKFLNSVKFIDTCPELIILKGAIEFHKFILNIKNNIFKMNDIPIEWIPVNNNIIENNYTNMPKKMMLKLLLTLFLTISNLVELMY
jgi:hypothetical protein